MAGNDNPQTPEDRTAASLISGDNTSTTAAPAEHKPDFTAYIGQPNADKPGGTQPAPDKQAGGPKDPGDKVADSTAAAPAAKPADTTAKPADTTAKPADTTAKPADTTAKPADTTAKPADTTAKPADTTAKPADGSDKTRTQDVVAANAHGLDVMQKVNSILDNDVPKFNKAHDLDDAKKAYDQAIALAKTLTPQEIAQAQHDLEQVRKDKKAASDPDTQRDLANKEVALYTVTRLQDAALGNMALWYYRQGKTEDGNAKLLEASGVDPATAQQLKKMGQNEIAAFGAIVTGGSSISPILGDANFFRQINNIKKSGVNVPDIFGQVNQAVIQHNADVAAGRTQDKTTPAGADKGAPGSDKTAADPKDYDADKANAAMQAFIDLNNQIKDHPAPLTADQRKIMEAGVQAYDAQNGYVSANRDLCTTRLNQLIDPKNQDAFGKASDAVDAELNKLAKTVTVKDKDGKDQQVQQFPDDVQTKLTALVGAKNPTDWKAAVDDLNKTQPDLTKALTAAAALIQPGANIAEAQQVYHTKLQLDDAFGKSSTQQIFSHYTYAKLLQGGKTPPDAADVAKAKAEFISGFKGTPQEVAAPLLASDAFQDLGKKLGLADQIAAQPAGADKGAPGGATPDANSQLSTMDVDTLQAKLGDAIKQGPAGMADAKAIFQEEIKRAEDPEHRKFFTDTLTSNVTALESGKDDKGVALDAAGRQKLQMQNAQLIQALSMAAQLHSGYATYLGDGRLNLDDDSKNIAKIDGGLNQLKSMDAEQRKAIAAADSIDPKLLKRADDQLNADRKAGIGDQKILDQLHVALEGGKDANGDPQLGSMNLRVTLRDQLAALYLMQGKQFKPDGTLMAQAGGSTHHTDELFKPQDALELLKQAQAANQSIWGKDAHDINTDRMYALGQTVQPDVFKNNASDLKSAGANAASDFAALGGSIAGNYIIRFAAGAILEAATDGKVNPTLLNAIGNAGAIGSGILTRHLVHGAITGQSESWADSALHGTAAALIPIGFKFTSELLNSNKLSSTVLNVRASGITGEALVQRAAGTIGPEATFADVAQTLKASGLTKEAGALEALGTKTVSSASADELAAASKAMNLDGARGREALTKMFPTMDRAATDANYVKSLSNQGINTVGQLQANLDQRAADVTQLSGKFAPTVRDNTPISTALKDLKDGAGARVYTSQEAIDKEASSLAANNIKTVGQLRAVAKDPGNFFKVGNLFPEMAGAGADTPLRDIGLRGGLGGATTEGRVQLGRILPETDLAKPIKTPGWLSRGAAAIEGSPKYVANKLWNDRMWKVTFDRPVVSFPNMAGKASTELVGAEGAAGVDAAATAGSSNRLVNIAGKLKPEFGTPSLPNLQKIDPLYATAKQVGIADSQTKFWNAAISGGAAMGQYNAATGLYDNWWKGKQYQDSKGQWHSYSFMGSLGQAAYTTAGEALVAGMVLKGNVAPALEAASPITGPATGWLARKIPILGSQVAREAVAGGGTQLKSFLMYGAIGTPMVMQGYTDLRQAGDKQATYESTQKPLSDAVPDDVGTQADQVQGDANKQPAPTTDNTPAQTPATPQGDGTQGTPDPNKDVPTKANDASPKATTPPAAQPAAQPAAKPAAKPAGNNVGGDLAPPGK